MKKYIGKRGRKKLVYHFCDKTNWRSYIEKHGGGIHRTGKDAISGSAATSSQINTVVSDMTGVKPPDTASTHTSDALLHVSTDATVAAATSSQEQTTLPTAINMPQFVDNENILLTEQQRAESAKKSVFLSTLHNQPLFLPSHSASKPESSDSDDTDDSDDNSDSDSGDDGSTSGSEESDEETSEDESGSDESVTSAGDDHTVQAGKSSSGKEAT